MKINDHNFDFVLYDKQNEAFHILRNSVTTELCYGGAAGGAKSFLGCAWQIVNRLQFAGTRGLIGRARLKNLKNTTFKTFLEVAKLMGLVMGEHFTYSDSDSIIRFKNGSEIYLKDLFHYPSDPDFAALGSLEISDAFVDEAGEVSERAVQILSSRIRYRLGFMQLPPKVLLTCNPARNWLYGTYWKAHRNNTLPVWRTFLPALITDNGSPEFVANYKKQLQKLDFATRERLLFGNWDYADDAFALFKYDAIQAMFSNSLVPAGPASISADVARFGADSTVIGLWKGFRLEKCICLQKVSTAKSAEQIIKLAKEFAVPNGRIIIDADGIGGGVIDYIPGVKSFIANSRALPRKGMPENYPNLKTQCYFHLAEAVAAQQIFIAGEAAGVCSHGQTLRDVLPDELMVIKRSAEPEKGLHINSKSEMKESLGRSPDIADMMMMRMALALQDFQFQFS
ncbi:MAG: phage terminase large subunit [Bacteroidota bacterium]